MFMALVLYIGLDIASGQSTFSSYTFQTGNSNYYQNAILNCVDTRACTIKCAGSSTCYNAEINCPDNYDCTLTCSGSSSCAYANLRCPKGTGACKVTCSGLSSCHYTNFNWTEGNTNTLSCTSIYCRGIIYPPIPDTTAYTMSCDDTHECYQSTIVCPNNGNCNVSCSGFYGCYEANIIGPKESGDLTVTCSNSYSCHTANIECPAGDGSCSLSCSGSEVCVNTEINWTNYSLSTFSCTNTDDCRGVNYPKPDSDEPYTLECEHHYECQGSTILCPESQPCNILCKGSYGCFGASIHCPSTHDCNIFAQGSESFHDGIIYCPESAMCNVYCTGPDGCEDAVALWAPNHFYANLGCPNKATDPEQCNILQNPLAFDPNPPNNNEIFNFVCDQTKECASSVITCPTDADCIVDCHGYGSCAASTINCPINGNCYVYCLNTRACYYARVTAPVNGELDIRCQTQSTFDYSCTGVETIYPSVFPSQIPTTIAPFTYSPTAQPTKSTVQLGIEDIQETQQDIIEGIVGLEADISDIKIILDLPTASPTTHEPTQDPTAYPTITWVDGLTLGGDENKYNGEYIDNGADEFNSIFWNSTEHIIRRECDTCIDEYKEIYYKRLTNTDTFNAYKYMKQWQLDRDNNKLGADFKLYTSITDALQIADNFWLFCDFSDDGSKGAFSICGTDGWDSDDCSYPLDANSDNYDPHDICNKEVKFSIFVGDPRYYGVDIAHKTIANERQSIGDIDGDNGYKTENYSDEYNAGLVIVVNGEQLYLILIGLIGFILIIINGVYIGCKCGCCVSNKSYPCSGAQKYRFRTVKLTENDVDKFEAEEHEVEMEQIEETK